MFCQGAIVWLTDSPEFKGICNSEVIKITWQTWFSGYIFGIDVILVSFWSITQFNISHLFLILMINKLFFVSCCSGCTIRLFHVSSAGCIVLVPLVGSFDNHMLGWIWDIKECWHCIKPQASLAIQPFDFILVSFKVDLKMQPLINKICIKYYDRWRLFNAQNEIWNCFTLL